MAANINLIPLLRKFKLPSVYNDDTLDDESEWNIQDDVDESGRPHEDIVKRNLLDWVVFRDPAPCIEDMISNPKTYSRVYAHTILRISPIVFVDMCSRTDN